MPRLILIKHAAPQVDPQVPAAEWRLSASGRDKALALADRLRAFAPQRVVSSEEPKAAETATILADALGLPCSTSPNLHEHDRGNVPHMRSGEFIANVQLFFRRPTELVLGRETADAAYARFAHAIDRVLVEGPDETLAIVAHGTVISLFVARYNPQQDGFDLWRTMQLPSFAVLTLPDYRLEQIDCG